MPTARAARFMSVKTVARAIIVAALCATVVGGIAGCGQRGPLFYPDNNNPDRRR